MPAIHEVATLTSKGQITLPKPIRQALGVDAGGKVAFDLKGGRVIVTRVTDEPHQDPAIGSFLALLEKDIQSGRHITAMPDELARSMLARLGKQVDLNEDIQGDVAL
ncbi:regulators of stationary/sporulation gene expression [Serpentinimonas raichei]|uniref:Regulators of stationary/sporulation gene expression n=1 Tax=Serpentinimonas raichei TaxID=1458425 RepID=A0A060NMW7_9BURK|nr:type II toxin-antitoxin system PrlF family antitoxin [Serpentinimonas raichei]MDO8274141.1 type II toxin-antitoxin system PrlF family antitoxin [Serpentinimonas sp.]BAO80838.1 regulators of stationary/sporulation gene expression [Serpentinimonas raichei]